MRSPHIRPLIACLAAVILSVASSFAHASDAEREAGEILAKSGAKAYDSGDFEEAARKFEQALEVMYGGQHDQAGGLLLNFLGRTYAKLGRCQEALPILLKAASDQAPPALEAARVEAVARCRGQFATFTTDTPERQAAHKLFMSARDARNVGQHDRASKRYRQALAISDEPVIRIELAEFLFAQSQCAGALAVLAPLSQKQLPAHIASERRRCADSHPGGSTIADAPPAWAKEDRPIHEEPVDGLAIGGWVSVGVGAALAVVGTLFAVTWADDIALHEENYRTVEALVPADVIDGPAWVDAHPSVSSASDAAFESSVITLVSLSTAVAAIGTGIVLLSVSPGEDDASAFTITPMVGPTHAGFSVQF